MLANWRYYESCNNGWGLCGNIKGADMTLISLLHSTDSYGKHYYFADGVRISRQRWDDIDRRAARKDCFITRRVKGMWHFRHTAYV